MPKLNKMTCGFYYWKSELLGTEYIRDCTVRVRLLSPPILFSSGLLCLSSLPFLCFISGWLWSKGFLLWMKVFLGWIPCWNHWQDPSEKILWREKAESRLFIRGLIVLMPFCVWIILGYPIEILLVVPFVINLISSLIQIILVLQMALLILPLLYFKWTKHYPSGDDIKIVFLWKWNHSGARWYDL